MTERLAAVFVRRHDSCIMHVLPEYRRLLLLTEGHLGVFTSKTAASLLRYRPDDVAAVVDARCAVRAVRDFIPWAPERLPIVPDIGAATALAPDVLCIGVTPVGGVLPPAMRPHVVDGLAAGLDVISGLHEFLADDPELAALAARRGGRIFDLRRPPPQRIIAGGRARQTRARRVLTVGTDGNVGKMVAGLELTAAARQRGLDARFVATGQTGILIAGRGVTVDACVADFAAGAVEQAVLAAGDCDLCVIEGQGSLGHPGFSGVTLALLHGACPDALVLVHHVERTHYRAPPHDPLPSLTVLRAAYEQVAALLHPARVVGVALNTHGLGDAEAEAARAELEAELGLPVDDALRAGAQRLLDAVLGR